MNIEVKNLKEKVSELYIQYVSLSGCDARELAATYDSIAELTEDSMRNEKNYSEEDLQQLSESYKKLFYIKSHKITGVIIKNGIKTKYSNKDGLVTAQLMEE